MNRKLILSIISVLLIIGGFIGYRYYQNIFGEIVEKNGAIYIRSNDNIGDVKKELIEFIGDKNNFFWLAEKKKYGKPKAGKYMLTKGMSLNDVINLLRSGNQTPIKLSFNNQDTLEKFSGRIAEQIEADSTTILNTFKDSLFLAENKFTEASVLGICIPNTYEIYWNTSAEKFRSRMLKEYNRFWNNNRLEKAKVLKMTPNEVMALASIVYKETPKAVEQPRVAGLYLNRIKKGIPLQADPTIIYILKQQFGQDFEVKRVLYKDLKIESPYNTYLHYGVPPSLIAMPDITSIDAVLNYERHDYLYMCVNIDKFGYHAFASSLKQHNRNAAKYQRWLNKQGINR
ncbi:MAG: endolytic transglycosylase MltG [Flavobacteriaceae bacterium]